MDADQFISKIAKKLQNRDKHKQRRRNMNEACNALNDVLKTFSDSHPNV